MATVTLHPAAYEGATNVNGGVYNPSGFIGKGATTYGTKDSHASIDTANMSPAYVYWTFNTSEIPQNAEISSVVCEVCAYAEENEDLKRGILQLYAGSTAKGNPTYVYDIESFVTRYTISSGAWTREELNSLRLRTEVESTGFDLPSLSLYGADLTITYTVTYTVSDSGGNGGTTETIAIHPSAHNATDYSYASISNATSPVGKSSSNTSTYAQINLTTGSRATTHIRWPFDCSAIPEKATIDSVECKVAALISITTSSYISTRTLQLYSGTTAKGSPTNIAGTTRSVHTLTCGTWTRDELQNCNLYIYAVRGTSSTTTSRYIRFYGADLTITYTYQRE